MIRFVSRQGRPPRKSPLAILKRAFIWPLARVYSSMSGQGTRVTEWLSRISIDLSRAEYGKSEPFHRPHTCAASRLCGHVHGRSELTAE